MTNARTRVANLAAAVAALALGWTAVIWMNDGITLTVAGIRVSSNNAWRPLAVGLAGAGIALALQGIAGTLESFRRIASRMSPTFAGWALALTTAGISAGYNSWTAGGADAFAYVSQAALWRDGRLDIPVPLAAEAPWPNAIETFVPFGYHAAPDGTPVIVPITAPGVSLLMALAQLIGGHAAAFVVTPIAGGALVLLTFAIGRRVRSAAVGLTAAWLVATSPAVLFMLMWPMSDIPAAAVTALMIWLLLASSTGAALSAGLAASLGLITRPNFLAIVACVVVWLAIESLMWPSMPGRKRWRRVMAFLMALVPGACVMAAVNMRWYGSPFTSGYGTAGGLLSLEHVVTNSARYARWLAESSPLAFMGLAALVIPATRVWTNAGGRRAASLFGLVAAGALSVYLLYGDFTDWWYLRFLLPLWPALFVATAIVLDVAGSRGRLAAAMSLTIVLISGVAGAHVARSRGVFTLGDTERRYATVARLIAETTEPTAVILTCQHVGTVRYYAGRETLRFDVLDPAWLDRAMAWLSAQGRHAYILVEDWERTQFETRFAKDNTFGRLSYSPALAWQSAHVAGWIYLYDPARPNAPTAHPGPEIERGQPLSANPIAFPRRR